MKHPLYRHRLLYAENKLYIRDKYIDKSQIDKLLKLHKKINSLLKDIKKSRKNALNEITFNFQYDCEPKEYHDKHEIYTDGEAASESVRSIDFFQSDEEMLTSPDYWDYSNRYRRIRTNGIFFSNVNYIKDILMHSSSRGEFCIKCTLAGIPEEYKNYAILYMMTTRDRWFEPEFRYFDKKSRKQYRFERLSDMERWDRWNFILEIYDDIMDGKLGICSYDEFIKEQI